MLEQEEGDEMAFTPLRHGRRKEDTSVFAKIASLAIKYHWLGTIILIGFLALGFDFKTPAKLFAEIRGDIEAVKVTANSNKEIAREGLDSLRIQINMADQDRYALRTLMESSVIAQCLYYPKSIARTAGLPCARLFRERGIE